MKAQQQGQSLVEVIIALGVLMVVVVGFTNIVLTSLQNAKFARNQEEANQIARNAMEIVRVIRDQGTATSDSPPVSWDTIWNRSGYPINSDGRCYQISNDTFPNYTLSELNCTNPKQPVMGSIYTREIRFLDPGGSARDYLIVQVTVEWREAAGIRSVELSTNIARLY